MKKTLLAWIIVITTSPIYAKTDNNKLPSLITHQDGISFQLCKEQLITKAFFFDVVQVGLYYENCPKDISIFDESEKLLRFHYLREVTGKQFKEGAEKFLKHNLSPKEFHLCFHQYQAINDAYVDVKKDDYYDLFKLKEHGLDLYLNQKPLSRLKIPNCESLYLKIWFGDKSMSSDFEKLLSH